MNTSTGSEPPAVQSWNYHRRHVIECMDEAAATQIADHIFGSPSAVSPLADQIDSDVDSDDEGDDGAAGALVPA